jgi:hypothetical protein
VPDDLAWQRLQRLGLAGDGFSTAVDVVRSLGAVQSQDYRPASWSVAMRTPGVTQADFDTAFDRGDILRTHVLRPTWHFVLPEDIRWLLTATAPRIRVQNGAMERQLQIDLALRLRVAALFERALSGGRHRTRTELAAVLAADGVSGTKGQRLAYLVMSAELDGVICSGARRGTQHTYALLEERAPAAAVLDDDAALAALTRRYFTGHGPATAKDLATWASLTMAQVRHGLHLVDGELDSCDIDGVAHFDGGEVVAAVRPRGPVVHLLQAYDEYVMGYSQSRGVLDRAGIGRRWQAAGRFVAVVTIDTQLAGAWRVLHTRDGVDVTVELAAQPSAAERTALTAAAARYGQFAGAPVRVQLG